MFKWDLSEYRNTIINSSEEVQDIIFNQIFRPWYRISPLKNHSLYKLHLHRNQVISIVEEMLKKYPNSTPALHLLMDAYALHKSLVEAVTTFLTVGYETTASVTSFLLNQLALNSKLQEDIRNTLMSDDEELLEMAILESLRLHPSGWIILRVAKEDTEIKKMLIPSGTFIVISPYIFHTSAKYWNNPLDFNPERFRNMHRTPAFIPFGNGIGKCVGRYLALQEIKETIMAILSHFELQTNTKAKVHQSILLRTCLFPCKISKLQ